MTFGYCINMLAPSGSDGTGRELLPMIGGLGFDYVELPMAQMMAYDEASFEQLFVLPLREAGLPCHCCNNFFPGSIRLTGPEADHAAAVAYAERAMARAEALGAHKIVFGSSGARNYPLGYAREDAMAQMRELLCRLEPLAARPVDQAHAVKVEEVEEDWYVTFSHPMEKDHFFRFAAYVATERVLLVRLYPEQGGEFRIPQLRGGGKLYLCCSRDGLFEVKI